MKQAIHLLETLKHGGAENVAYNYAKVLSNLGVSSTFVAMDSSAEYKRMLQEQGICIEKQITGSLWTLLTMYLSIVVKICFAYYRTLGS
jgi:dihydroxyacetone kinase